MGRPPRAAADAAKNILPETELDDDNTDAELGAGNLLASMFGTEQENFSCWIYRYEGISGQRREMVYRKEGEIPSLEFVYDAWGPGRYMWHARDNSAPGKMGKLYSRIEIIGKNFMGRPPACDAPTSAVGATINPFGQMDAMLTVFERLAAILQAKATPAGPEGSLGMMAQVMNLSQNLMTESIKTNAKLAGEAQREIMGMRSEFNRRIQEIEAEYQEEDTELIPAPADDTAEGQALAMAPANMQNEIAKAAVQVLAPLIEEHLPKLLGDGPFADLVISGVKNTQLYRQLMGEPQALDELKGWIRTEHADDADVLFRKFGI